MRRILSLLLALLGVLNADKAQSAGFLQMREKWRISFGESNPNVAGIIPKYASELEVYGRGSDGSVLVGLNTVWMPPDASSPASEMRERRVYWINSEGGLLHSADLGDYRAGNYKYFCVECKSDRVVFIRYDSQSGTQKYLHQFILDASGMVAVKNTSLSGYDYRSIGRDSFEPPGSNNPWFMLGSFQIDDQWGFSGARELICFEFVDSVSVGLSSGTDPTGPLELTATVPAGQTATIQQSVDMTSWVDAQEVQGSADGSAVTVTVQRDTDLPSQFLRVQTR